jgi:asparagine synthase (glutamine-hydrolysing)
MASADGRSWIAYNGEVFNYVELRAELAALGHAFRGGSDTEVLLAAYAQWGEDCLPRLNGMFAFALFDAARRRLFLARDRFGVKPLVFHAAPGLFAFASETKGLLAHPAVPADPDLGTLGAFLGLGAVDEGERTFLLGVRRLAPGHALTVDLASGALAVRRWYALPAAGAAEADGAGLRARLEDSVRVRLRSDVPIGTCLSGGLDSSSIVALTRRLQGEPGEGRLAFSAVFDDPGLDERRYMEAVARATGVTHRVVTPTAADLAADLPALARAQDEPFGSSSVYAQYRVMRLARESGVTVLLDGQGADEVLGGYHYHYGPWLAGIARARGLRAAMRAASAAHQVTGRPWPFFLGLLAYHRGLVPSRLRATLLRHGASQGVVPRAALDADVLQAGRETRVGRHAPRAGLGDELRAGITETSLPALLRYEDRNSMAWSIEARTPFLDYRLVEYVAAAPPETLIRDGWTKALLRDATAGLVPDEVRARRDKIGFAAPEGRWLTALAPAVRDWLGPGARTAGIVPRGVLDRWRADDDATLAARPGLWRVLSAELWLRAVAERPSAAAAPALATASA